MGASTKFGLKKSQQSLFIYLFFLPFHPFPCNVPCLSPWKHQKTFGFLLFSGGSQGNIGKKQVNILWRTYFLKICTIGVSGDILQAIIKNFYGVLLTISLLGSTLHQVGVSQQPSRTSWNFQTAPHSHLACEKSLDLSLYTYRVWVKKLGEPNC